jgi:hypothetical protein
MMWAKYETGRGEVHVKPVDEEHDPTDCPCDPAVEVMENGLLVVIHESFYAARNSRNGNDGEPEECDDCDRPELCRAIWPGTRPCDLV